MTTTPRMNRLTVLPAALAALLALCGCASSHDAAWKMIQQQQEQQSMVRMHEADLSRREAPNEPQLLLSVMREAYAEGRYFAALAYMDAYSQRFGRNADVQALRADALRQTGQPEAAEAGYRALLSTPQAAQGWHGLGLLAGARDDFPAAADYLAKAAALVPTASDVLNDLGYARLRAGLWPQARMPLGQAAELDPANPRVLANLAVLLLLTGETERAHTVMTQAGLAPDARLQVQRLAAELRLAAAPPAPVATAPAGVDDAPVPVRRIGGAPASNTGRGGQVDRLPMQSPLLDALATDVAVR